MARTTRRSLFGTLAALILGVAGGGPAFASGLLVPDDVRLPALSMVSHRVTVSIEDQVASTTVEQTFRNPTSRNLEATYLFPVPRGASVNKFSMWVNGQETSGELLEAKKASQIYTDIVRRTQDPGLLEYIGNDLLRLRVFPIPPRGDQKVKVRFTSVAPMEQGVVEYVYPLKTDGRATRTLEEFSVKLTIKSQKPIQSVYSPTHAVSVIRRGDREALVEFERDQRTLDKDFQLFYGVGQQEVGLTPLLYRPVASRDGYAMLLITPQVEEAKARRVPRDLVLVLDTSGSMSDAKMSQAKKALKQILGDLHEDDRFGVIAFASTVRHYEEKLAPYTQDHHERARKWVDDLRTGGGTAIQPALDAALDLRSRDPGRTFTVVFYTDGMPTVDERDPVKIVQNVVRRNTDSTRIFTFGVGDDVNAEMLDQLAEATRAVSTYVRPSEDIEAKASALQAKIRRPVMTNVKLTATNVKLHEVYPPKLPDLFSGGQIVVIGRYSGSGRGTVTLSGRVGTEERELTYEVDFAPRTGEAREFVEPLWARRKVGYLLDQIRANGESKEVVEEVVALAKRYGIATPYTSYLVVPDGPMPVIRRAGESTPSSGPSFGMGYPSLSAAPGTARGVEEFAKEQAAKSPAPAGPGGRGDGGIASSRGAVQGKAIDDALKAMPADRKKDGYGEALQRAKSEVESQNEARGNYVGGRPQDNRQGRVGVDLAVASNALRDQNRLSLTANRLANGHNLVEIGGVWIDDRYASGTKTVTIEAQGVAYFRLLELQPKMKDVFRLGNQVLWVAPNGTAIIVDQSATKDELSDAAIEALFRAKTSE